MIGADSMLHLLKAEPTLLPPGPVTELGRAIERRRMDEIHNCLHCGRRAQCAFVAHTELGNRWLDLCAECAHWLRTTATQTASAT